MFKSLREKLKGWIGKAKEESEPVEDEVVIDDSKSKKTDKKDKKKEKKGKDAKKGDVVKGKKSTKKPTVEEKEGIIEETAVEGEVLDKGSVEEVIVKEEEVEVPSNEDDEEEPKGEEVEEPVVSKEKKSFFSRFRRTLTQEKFDEMFDELELILLQNNVAYEAVEAVRVSLQEKLVGDSASVDIAQALSDAIEELLVDPPVFLDEVKKVLDAGEGPFIMVFAGINGAGKTTTIAKVAHFLKQNGLSVCLAAADTFRAASIEQIGEHAKRLDIPLIKKDYGSDPAAVGFDAVSYAKKNKVDVVLIDTAGRMQNRDSLMREIEKITRVSSPHMKIFLGESITGNDATQQAKAFNEAIDLTGIILSKADVDEKGGTAISVSHVTGKPILFLGVGQEYGDLEVFDKHKLIEKLGLA